jgi:tetratricopeptide (TPR) repeat protein
MGSPAELRRQSGRGPDFGQAVALHRQGRLREAEQIYASILAEDPGQFEALHLLGLARHQQGRAVEALRLIGAALQAKPDSADALSNCGVVLDALKRHDEALASFDRALALDRRHVDALNNRAATLANLGRAEEALASWDEALTLDPDHLQALHNRGNALHGRKRHEAALADYDRFLALGGRAIDVLNNRGGSLAVLGRLAQAIESYDRAIAIDPRQPELLINKAHVLADCHEFDRALSIFAQAAALKGRRAEASWCASLVRLRLGDFARGWQEYEWRWSQASWASQRRQFVAPLWLGQESLAGRTILLHAEQGCGDTLQFVRYASKVAALGATVLLEVQPPLKPLLADLTGVAQVFARGEPLPWFELHCPLMSLPLAFATSLETIPCAIPYLRVPESRLRQWRERLGAPRSLRVGIAWAGSPAHKNDHNRSIGLTRLRALLSTPAVEFVSIQREPSEPEAAALSGHRDLLHVGEELRDFADTAAVISLMDLVVSVDTAVAHLAGALGTTVWVLLPFTPDFRWLLEREDSPWYPTARLFRQPRPGDWESVLGRVREALTPFAARRPSAPNPKFAHTLRQTRAILR